MSSVRFLLVLILGWLVFAGIVEGQFPEPLGSEFRVDPNQADTQDEPDAAMRDNGDFLLVWESDTNRDIAAQLFASDGSTIGAIFQVNTVTEGFQIFPEVAMAADGRFAIVWVSTEANPTIVKGRRFLSDGTPSGEEFLMGSSLTGASQGNPAIAMRDDGSFWVTWSCFPDCEGPTASTGIRARRFASDGTHLGSDFVVNTYTTASQTDPQIAMDLAGNPVIIWTSQGSADTDDSLTSIQGRLFTSGGQPMGADFQVNTFTDNYQRSPSVSMAESGDFIVSWQSDRSPDSDTSSSSIRARRFTSDGTGGAPFQVNSFTTGLQLKPDVAMTDAGEFVIVWESWDYYGTDDVVRDSQGQRFNADGSFRGVQFRASESEPFRERQQTVAINRNGEFVVAWKELFLGPPSYFVFGRRFDISDDSLFADRFEGGAVNSWSLAESLAVAPTETCGTGDTLADTDMLPIDLSAMSFVDNFDMGAAGCSEQGIDHVTCFAPTNNCTVDVSCSVGSLLLGPVPTSGSQVAANITEGECSTTPASCVASNAGAGSAVISGFSLVARRNYCFICETENRIDLRLQVTAVAGDCGQLPVSLQSFRVE